MKRRQVPTREAARALLVVGLAVAVALVAAYFLFLRPVGPEKTVDPLAQRRQACGNADALAGDSLLDCVELALDLMGREPSVPVDDGVARALLKKTCDQALERGCLMLRDYESLKVEFARHR